MRKTLKRPKIVETGSEGSSRIRGRMEVLPVRWLALPVLLPWKQPPPLQPARQEVGSGCMRKAIGRSLRYRCCQRWTCCSLCSLKHAQNHIQFVTRNTCEEQYNISDKLSHYIIKNISSEPFNSYHKYMCPQGGMIMTNHNCCLFPLTLSLGLGLQLY